MAADPPKPRHIRLTDRDRQLLAFVAEHRLVLGDHLAALLGVSRGAAASRLRGLAQAGYLSSRRIFDGQPGCHQITRSGLAAIGSDLRPPRLIDLSCYAHDVGVAWLWLAARAGKLGSVQQVIGERRLRSTDARPDRERDPLGVRLGGVGSHGKERLHYPDLLLITAGGERVALELELTQKGRARRETILSGYAADARIGSVIYLVERPSIGRAIQVSARRLAIAALVNVRLVRIPGAPGGAGRRPARERAIVAARGTRSAAAR